jgi:hypothetical protein
VSEEEAVFAVVGTWSLDAARADQQQAGLAGIVEGVRSVPGFVAGYWAADGTDRRHTFIAFDSRPAAEEFERGVRRNASNQAAAGVTLDSLTVTTVIASA